MTSTLPTIELVKEDVPTIVRPPGHGRSPIPWETVLAPIKEQPAKKDGTPQSFRIWVFDTRNKANSRKALVMARLRDVEPASNYRLDVREVPATDKTPAGSWGIYVTYSGEFTPAQVAANAKLHQERVDRNQKSRADKAARAESAADEAEAVAPKANGGKTGK